MTVENGHASPDEDEGVDSSLNLRLLLLSGLAVFIVVKFIASQFQPGFQDISDEQWLGGEAGWLVYVYGQPAEVEEDGQGGSILKYRRLQFIDHRYDVERFEVFVDPSGNVSSINREPTWE